MVCRHLSQRNCSGYSSQMRRTGFKGNAAGDTAARPADGVMAPCVERRRVTMAVN